MVYNATELVTPVTQIQYLKNNINNTNSTNTNTTTNNNNNNELKNIQPSSGHLLW